MSRKTLIPLLLCILLSFGFSCGEEEASDYMLTVDGYLGSFTGYYYIDGKLSAEFTGTLMNAVTNHYYYQKDLPIFTSVKIYVTKSITDSSVEATLWKDDRQIKSVSVGRNAKDSGGGDIMSLPELYYDISTSSTTSDTSSSN